MNYAHHDVPAHFGVRTRDFKLIFFYGLPLDAPGAKTADTQPGWELYDLRADPGESRNVYGDAAYADIANELKTELRRLRDETGDTDEKYPELTEVLRKHW